MLIVDDDEAMRAVLEERLSQWGYQPVTAESVEEAERAAAAEPPDIVVSDVVLGERDGLDLLRVLKATSPAPPMLLITAHATIDLSVEAMKNGAEDFLTKPLDYDKLRATLDAIAGDLAASREQQDLGAEASGSEARCGHLIGAHETMRAVYEQIEMVAGTDASILILGESGTGKEVTARTIHELSRRRSEAFIAINAAAIPSELMESEIFGHEKGAFTGATETRQGCFELAEGGTLFLDEIGEMSTELQPKLLRVLEDSRVRRLGAKTERHVDVRLLAATNQKPEEAVAEGRLRADLYYRLNVFTIELPPLRRRATDVPLLATAFLRELGAKHGSDLRGFRDSAMEILQSYEWPGNVRELRNVVERAVIVARDRWIEPGHLPVYLQTESERPTGDVLELPIGTTVADAERALILGTLEKTGNNKSEAARQLGIDVKTVRAKLKTYGEDATGEDAAED
ncbi:MAG: sigma-54 dependent transcriptional regulator [Acidobacteriota bacterium]